MALLAQSALAWLVLWGLCALAVELLLPLAAPRLRALVATGRVGIIVALCWLPAGVASALLLGSHAPWAAAVLGFGHDHCVTHGGHVHLCVQHVHPFTLGGIGWAVLVAAGGWLAVGLREVLAELRRGRALLASLGACADVDEEGVVVVEADVPWSVTAGIFHPRVLVTSALLARFSPRQQRVVLAHERLHVAERHAVSKLVAALGAVAFRRSTRRTLLDALTLACERRCDEHAAADIGDRLEVASTLLAARRALAERLPLGVLALLGGAHDLEIRVRGLTDPSEGSAPPAVAVPAVMIVVAMLVVGYELHHAIETLLAFLLH